MSAIKNWSSLSESTTDKIACQPLWYNKELKIGTNSAYNNNLFSIRIWYVGDLFEGGNVIPFETWRRRGAREADKIFFLTIYLPKNIPTCTISNYTCAFESPTFMSFHEEKNLIFYAISACFILSEENVMIL